MVCKSKKPARTDSVNVLQAVKRETTARLDPGRTHFQCAGVLRSLSNRSAILGSMDCGVFGRESAAFGGHSLGLLPRTHTSAQRFAACVDIKVHHETLFTPLSCHARHLSGGLDASDDD